MDINWNVVNWSSFYGEVNFNFLHIAHIVNNVTGPNDQTPTTLKK